MTSPPSILDRFTSPRNRNSFLSPRQSPQRSPSEYTMEELEPRPVETYANQEAFAPRSRHTGIPTAAPNPSVGSWIDWPSSASSRSSSKGKSRALFAGPPPPIARSMVLNSKQSRPTPNRAQSGYTSNERPPEGISGEGVSEVIFDHGAHAVSRSADSVWRGLQRQERALESDIQQLLDLQATGLIAGSGGVATPKSKEADGYSDSGSSTPTGTFYSTATSKSRMVNSLYVPTRATSDGNVIPVRQPTRGRATGLSAARVGLQGSINALADLKREEDAYIDVSLAQRKKALVQLGRLSARKDGISSELHTLEEDEGEPLGQELRDLGSKYESITQEIRALEEKLVGMRNRRRWLKDKMEDVRNKREAGLSGYRGALKDVESELTTILKRPPVKPLDPEMYGKVDDSEGLPANSSGGEFLQLLPERRTIDMAKSWWEGEISLLERRKEQIAKERQALEEGSVVWGDVIRQVTNFESNLRQLMKTITSPQEPKEDSPPTEDLLREHTAAMDTVVTELERHMEEAEKKHWNLLICAIGAELEAFKEARNMLKGVFATADEASQEETCARESNEPQGIDQQEKSFANIVDDQPDESDNEVPPDLLVSHYEEHGCNPPSSSRSESDLHEDDSGNEIPPEFLDGEDRSSKGQ